MTERKHSIGTLLAVAVACGPMASSALADYVDLTLSYNPVAYWRLGEGSGNTAFDLVGGHSGTYHDGVGLGTDGIIPGDSAVQFHANGPGYAQVPHSSDFLMDNGTVSFWFKDTGSIRSAGLFSKDSSGYDTGGHLTMYTTSSRFKVRLQSTSTSYRVESNPIQLDIWYNVAFTFGDDGMRLYMDGALVDSGSYTGGLAGTSGGVGNFEPIVFGANTWVSGNHTPYPLRDFFSGVMDEVAIYDYALSEGQITNLYSVGVPEPATLLLLGLGAATVLRRRRRQ